MRRALPAILVWTVLVASCEGVIFLSNDRAVLRPEGTTDLARDFGRLAMQMVGAAWIIGLLVMPLIGRVARRQEAAVRAVAYVGGAFLTLVAAAIVVERLHALFD